MNNEIPYPLKLLATQVDPNLDQNWQITLQRLFAEIQPHQREIICQHILQQRKSTGIEKRIVFATLPNMTFTH